MLVLHSWTTPNGRKVPILLEELGLAYEIHFVDISKNEQFEPDFLAIAPNNKIPALVDYGAEDGPLSIFESGAILTYLADKHGRFLAPHGHARWKAMEWLYWQVGGLGPMLGQLGFFAVRSKEKAPLAIHRFTEEAERLLGVLERRLGEARYLAGDDYTIADIAAYPWMVGAATVQKEVLADAFRNKPAIARWMDELGARPAVQRGMAIKPPPKGIS
ncbi:glutathione S-transferase N-terminal domain-containing protein [Sphingomonas sp. PR090111-T3T-6A]|uniref:glutathione S-transferase N-terminal domain-containing protein n=1 Tax=Sphingomonas sp. PR090111-T3T-6A TaxID=685778 RepID=UPI0003A89961|nr:glutathione S-transferase N-terminal domain-containing protein [Sphingomonas sp. PR090111-T3T-6A]